MQMVRAGLKAIYLSGWQVAADANTAGAMYPDQSLIRPIPGRNWHARSTAPCSAPIRSRRLREQATSIGLRRLWQTPRLVLAALNAFELTRSYQRRALPACISSDQLASEKKCGHMGGKVLIPVQQHVANLNAARLAADTAGVPTMVVARTDAESAKLITSDIDERDHRFLTGERTEEGFFRLDPKDAFERCVVRGNAFAEYADLLWMETSTPDLDQAKRFAEAIHREHPNQMMAYNCSPSFNWSANLSQDDIARFQREIGAMGYKYQFITLAGFHSMNYSMFELASGYRDRGMAAYCELQNAEFDAEDRGYTATRHQREVGAGWFDAISVAVKGGQSATTAMDDSTEEAQFQAEESLWQPNRKEEFSSCSDTRMMP